MTQLRSNTSNVEAAKYCKVHNKKKQTSDTTYLRFSTLKMPSAKLHAASPHCRLELFERNIIFDKSIPEEDRKNANYGCNFSAAVYKQQDNYDRSRNVRSFKTAVLENNYLRAEFLIEQGGRLWSLIDKQNSRELLYVNPVYQPGNLAIRNAWFSGGIEWNVGLPAHSPFTCEKPFFAVLYDKKRGPILRMYEFERIRCAPYQVDFYLPPDSKLLHVRTILRNPHAQEIPAYWFSNIAVPLSPDIRVLVPASFACTSGYEAGKYCLMHIDVPKQKDGMDNSYPYNGKNSRDIFYHIDVKKEQPWITAVDETGKGLFQTSTAVLKGRKMFVWGVSPGGNRWQEFLSEPNHPYFEIQAGLGRTQAECVPLEAFGKYEWLETYGMIETNPEIVHGSDWQNAANHVKKIVQDAAPINYLEKELNDTAELAGQSPDEIVQHGSGWAVVECKRRQAVSENPLCQNSLVFSNETIGPDEKIWSDLLENGAMKPNGEDCDCGGYMTQKEWIPILSESMKNSDGDNWLSRLHLGILYYSNDASDAAIEQWLASIRKKENIFAYRNIGFAFNKKNKKDLAIEYYKKAWELNKSDYTIATEFLDLLLEEKKYDIINNVLGRMPELAANHPRVLVAKAKYNFLTGNFKKAESLLESIILPDLREGDTALTDMWFEIQARKLAKEKETSYGPELLQQVKKELVPPKQLDFRMADL
jgi:tetratricopeptide (TPR) repeat protein